VCLDLEEKITPEMRSQLEDWLKELKPELDLIRASAPMDPSEEDSAAVSEIENSPESIEGFQHSPLVNLLYEIDSLKGVRSLKDSGDMAFLQLMVRRIDFYTKRYDLYDPSTGDTD
jgi:hypothetical protein